MSTTTAKRRFDSEAFDSLLPTFNYDSLKDFSAKTGIKLRTLHELRSGTRNPNLGTIADVLGAFKNIVAFDKLFPLVEGEPVAIDEYADLRLVA